MQLLSEISMGVEAAFAEGWLDELPAGIDGRVVHHECTGDVAGIATGSAGGVSENSLLGGKGLGGKKMVMRSL